MQNGAGTRIGMVRCEHCQRQFNPHSAARHIPWCKKQQTEAKKRRLTADKIEALERYRWRIGYKPTNKISSQQPARADNGTKSAGRDEQRNKTVNANHYETGYENGVEESEDDDEENQDERRRAGSVRQIGNAGKRPPGAKSQHSINSSATFSSPSASSITSLNTSITSMTNGHQNGRQNTNRALASSSKQQTRADVGRAEAARLRDKLKRSVSSVTLNKQQRGPGSASSRHSRVSAATIGTADELHRPQATPSDRGRYERAQAQSAASQLKAKSVSDLTNMSEIVETLAKRMEEIYAQNQLLLASIMRSKRACDAGSGKIDTTTTSRGELDSDSEGDNDELDDGAEFGQCHHCRARCLIEANYCHKCGCKLRPSNPSPPVPD